VVRLSSTIQLTNSVWHCVGYESDAAFGKALKRVPKATPGDYRQGSVFTA